MPTSNTHKNLEEKILQLSSSYSAPRSKEELLDPDGFLLAKPYVVENYLGYSFDQVRERGDDMRGGFFEEDLMSMSRNAFEFYTLAWLLNLLDDHESDASIMLPSSIQYVLEKFGTGLRLPFLEVLAEFASDLIDPSFDYPLAGEDVIRWDEVRATARSLLSNYALKSQGTPQ